MVQNIQSVYHAFLQICKGAFSFAGNALWGGAPRSIDAFGTQYGAMC